MIELEDRNWRQVDKDLWDLAYQSRSDDILYVKDNYKNHKPFNQTEFDDFDQERYEVRLRRKSILVPRKNEEPINEETLLQTDDWEEVVDYLDPIVS